MQENKNRSDKTKSLSPYVVSVQQNSNIYGGEVVEVSRYAGLYTIKSETLDGKEVMSIFTTKPSDNIDKVGVATMSLFQGFKSKESSIIKVKMDKFLEEVGSSGSKFNKDTLISDLHCFYGMNVVINDGVAPWELRFLSGLQIDEVNEIISFSISEIFLELMGSKKVRSMPTAVSIEFNSKNTRSLYRLLHSRGRGDTLVNNISIDDVEKYLGINSNSTESKRKTLMRCFKDVEKKLGIKYKRANGKFSKITKRISNRKKVDVVVPEDEFKPSKVEVTQTPLEQYESIEEVRVIVYY